MVSPTRRHFVCSAAAIGSALAGCAGTTTNRSTTGETTSTEATASETDDSRTTVEASEYDGADGGEQIAAAMDDLPATGGTVFVPPAGPDAESKWSVSAPIDVRSGVRLVGDPGATTLYLADGTNDDVVQTATDRHELTTENISIVGFVIEGNAANNTDSPSGKTGKNVGVRLIDVDGAHVSNCSVTNFYGHGIEVKVSRNVVVEGCTATVNGDDGVSVSDIHFESAYTENVVVRDCVAEANADSGFEVDDGPKYVTVENCRARNNRDGFVVHTHGTHAAPAAPQHVIFRNCTALNNDAQGFRCGDHDSDDPRRYRFESVTAVGNEDSAFALEPAGNAVSDADVRHVTVDGFHFEGANESATVVDLTHPAGTEHITVKNGIVTGTGRNGLNVGGRDHSGVAIENIRVDGENISRDGIRIETGRSDITDVAITGCEVHDAGGAGVLLWGGSGALRRGEVAGNDCYNNGQDTTRRDVMRAGISIGTDDQTVPSGLTVRNNACYDDQATPTQLYGIWHDRDDANTYSQNEFRGNETAGFGGANGE